MTDPDEIAGVLKRAEICRIGLLDGETAYIVPMNFGYADGILYFHSSPEGKKIGILRKRNRISFEIDTLIGIKKGERACDWSAVFISVMGNGSVEFVNDSEEKTIALNLIMEKYSGRNDWTFKKNALSRTLIFKLTIDNISCRATPVRTAEKADNITEP